MAGGAVVPLIRVLPAILRLFPVMREIPIIRGFAFPLNDMQSMSDPELERALQQNLRPPRRQQVGEDSSYVIKVDVAIECAREVLSNGKFTKLGVLEAANILTGATRRGTSPILDAIAKKIRDRALGQRSPRGERQVGSYWKRPCHGHGYGNPGNLRRGNV